MGPHIRVALQPHPLSCCNAVDVIEVEVARSGFSNLSVRYRVSGNLRNIRLPLPSGSTRADELWRHTCFELFLSPMKQQHYYEFNFAPSLQWAACRFAGYRRAMSALSDFTPPQIAIRQDRNSLELRAALVLERLPICDREVEWRLGLSAVIEEMDGGLSYWALEHPPGKPDFHHAQAFALRLSANRA